MSNIQINEALFKKLTNREIEIARLAKEGYSCKDTAQLLGVAKSTVGNTRSHIMQKTGCKNITECIVSLISAGIL